MSYRREDVVWSDDPFKDDPDAGRPWLVLNTDAHPFAEEQYMTVALSTSGYDAAIPVRGDDWVERIGVNWLRLYANRILVSTSIRVSDDTKRMLESLKRENETFDALLERLAESEQPIEIGAWSEAEAVRARAAVKRSRESFER